MATNQQKFNDLYWQICDGSSWFWGKVAETVMNYPVKWYGHNGKTQPEGARNTTSLSAFLGWVDSGFGNLSTGIGEAKTLITAVHADVKTLLNRPVVAPTAPVVDVVALQETINAAVKAAALEHFGEIGTYELKKKEDKA